MNVKSIRPNERKEIATWLSGYLAMVKKWVDKILDNENHDVDKNKILNQINDWILWLEDIKLRIMKMKDVDPEEIKEEVVIQYNHDYKEKDE